MQENNKTLKLTGLTKEEVDKLLLMILSTSTTRNTALFDIEAINYKDSLASILLDREVSIHYDTINNKDHIIRF